MSPDQVGTIIGTAAAAGFALWRAMHADKVAARVEAKTETQADATHTSLERGNTAFQALRDQNRLQGERISALEARLSALDDVGARLAILETRLMTLMDKGKTP
jgi:predicted metalloendopeptidase